MQIQVDFVALMSLLLEMNIYTIAFTGENISSLSEIVDLSIYASSQETNHIQEMHIAIGQLICGAIEDKFFKRN